MKEEKHGIKLRFPIGKFEKPNEIETKNIQIWITDIGALPGRISLLVKNLKDTELNWVYRPGGWSIKQVVHHFADSHMNAIIRFKLALTEDKPTIKPYLQDRWATLADTEDSPIDDSLKILEGVHARLVRLLKSLNKDDLKREFIHPEYEKNFSIAENIGIYAWHCNHHLAHIKQAIEFKGKF